MPVPHGHLNHPAETGLEEFRGRIRVATGLKIPYYRTSPLGRGDHHFTKAVIVVHGRLRNADDYFQRVIAAARLSGCQQTTLIIAPRFQKECDHPAADEQYWTGNWNQGNLSVNHPRISSFAVIDEIFARLSDSSKFPRLNQIVIAGHSGGGQFANRYAAGGTATDRPDIEVRYLVMNPSSFVYLDEYRRDKDRTWVKPDVLNYNGYKYGLNDLNAYLKRAGAEKMRANMFTRRVWYLGGMEDTESENLDDDSRAMVQGGNRYERWKTYRLHVARFSKWKTVAVFEAIDGIGHSGQEMFSSSAARRVMFD